MLAGNVNSPRCSWSMRHSCLLPVRPTRPAQQVQVALGVLEPLRAKQPDDRLTLLATVGVESLLAKISAVSPSAQQLRSDALNAIDSVRSGGGDPRLLALKVEAMLGLDRRNEADPVIKQLWNSGYRDLAIVGLLEHEHIDYPINTVFQQSLQAAISQNDRR